MATLTPGVLLKLLQSMNSDSKPFGEHRSPVLQVTGIVPAPSSAPSSDDLWPSHGFYLQLSDSIHSTYVSLSDHDADLIVSNRPQLGQLVHLDRLQFDLPVPRATGLRPISSPRLHPFLGSPEPLIAISSPSHTPGFIIQPVSPSKAAATVKPRAVLAPKENFYSVTSKSSSGSNSTASKPKRRFSSPASRNPSPAVEKQGSRGRAPSPVPSKCEVPSLVAAKTENRRMSREPAILVPSRYRHPSPVGRKATVSPIGRKGSSSPGIRRLSIGLKLSPAVGDGGGKRKAGMVVAGISRVSDALASSGRSVRKSWDDNSSSSETSSVEIREKGGYKKHEQGPIKVQVATKCRVSDTSSHKAFNEEKSTDENSPTSIKIADSIAESPNILTPKVAVYDRKWTDGSIPLDSVSQKLACLGKEAFERRNIVSKAAAEALEEALATESIIRSLSMFSDLCLTSKTGNPLRTINSFLSIYDDIVKGISIVSSLVTRHTENKLIDTLSINRFKSASIWVEAALRTDLEVLNLINSTSENHSMGFEKVSIPCGDFSKSYSSSKRCSHVNKTQPKSSSSTHCSSSNFRTMEFAESLRTEMQLWFLKFVEEAIGVGFFLFGDKETSFMDNSRVAAVVFHLKRVSDWIDMAFGKPVDKMLEEKIEQVRQKIYSFVMTHMGLMKPASNSWDAAHDEEDDVMTGMGSAFDRALSIGKS